MSFSEDFRPSRLRSFAKIFLGAVCLVGMASQAPIPESSRAGILDVRVTVNSTNFSQVDPKSLGINLQTNIQGKDTTVELSEACDAGCGPPAVSCDPAIGYVEQRLLYSLNTIPQNIGQFLGGVNRTLRGTLAGSTMGVHCGSASLHKRDTPEYNGLKQKADTCWKEEDPPEKDSDSLGAGVAAGISTGVSFTVTVTVNITIKVVLRYKHKFKCKNKEESKENSRNSAEGKKKTQVEQSRDRV